MSERGFGLYSGNNKLIDTANYDGIDEFIDAIAYFTDNNKIKEGCVIVDEESGKYRTFIDGSWY